MNERSQSICLSMIVKNEAPVIERCLKTVLPIISHWVVVDTGSTDGTQEIVTRVLKHLPGELHERPWKDFAHNRSEALSLARMRADYSLVIDADDVLEFDHGFKLPSLTADSYNLLIVDSSIDYQRTQLVANRRAWRYEGVLHEFMTCDDAETQELLGGVRMRRNHDGARRRDPNTYRRDAEVLEAALSGEISDFLRSRYTFYLAQSYRDSGNRERALHHYLARAELGFWDQERFMSLYEAARIQEALNHAPDDVIATYRRATEACPSRVEALHGASRFCRQQGRNAEGYDLARRGLDIPNPKGGLFVESWIYDYGVLDELSVNAYWAGKYRESLDASLKLLGGNSLPSADRERVAANARFALEKLPGSSTLGINGTQSFQGQHSLVAKRSLRSRVEGAPRVLLAILAKQKERMLPLYLDCIEALDYPKSSIVLHVRTNNNTDGTERILREWLDRVGHLYEKVEFDAADVSENVQQFGTHEWNATRFRVLGRIRGISMKRALEHKCAFYFVVDVDNFVRPCTLGEMVALNLPIVGPMLRSVSPNALYSNYHAEVDDAGYFQHSDQYDWIVSRLIRGVVEVPVIHTTYLIRSDVLPELTYEDGSDRHEYVVFSDSARKAGIPQYIDNRQVYGYIAFDEGSEHHVVNGIDQVRLLLSNATDLPYFIAPPESESPRRIANDSGVQKAENLDNTGDARSQDGDGLFAPDFIQQFELRNPRTLWPAAQVDQLPRILIAILAKQKEKSLQLYLECIERLDYPTHLIWIYIRTNNNTDRTEEILRRWIEKVEDRYLGIEFDSSNVAANVEQFRVHEWNKTRFDVLGKIRNTSLGKTLEHSCEYYFTCDVDNFIAPNTLRELVALGLPIVAPFMRNVEAGSFNSNFFPTVDENGYYQNCAAYAPILTRVIKGIIEVPLVHHTYLIHRGAIPHLSYIDGSDRYEFVIFSDSARKASIPQYVDNRQVYGYITSGDEYGYFPGDLEEAAEAAKVSGSESVVEKTRGLMNRVWNTSEVAPARDRGQGANEIFSHIYRSNVWGKGSGLGSNPINAVPYIEFLQEFIRQNSIRSVVDFGCGDWQFSQYVDWSGARYTGVDVVEDVVRNNIRLFGREGVNFEHVTDLNALPNADLLICKDVLQHLSNDLVISHLAHFRRKYRYMLITNDDLPEHLLNVDIPLGDFRPIRIDRPPFNERAAIVFKWNMLYDAHGSVAPRKLVFFANGCRESLV